MPTARMFRHDILATMGTASFQAFVRITHILDRAVAVAEWIRPRDIPRSCRTKHPSADPLQKCVQDTEYDDSDEITNSEEMCKTG